MFGVLLLAMTGTSCCYRLHLMSYYKLRRFGYPDDCGDIKDGIWGCVAGL